MALAPAMRGNRGDRESVAVLRMIEVRRSDMIGIE